MTLGYHLQRQMQPGMVGAAFVYRFEEALNLVLLWPVPASALLPLNLLHHF